MSKDLENIKIIAQKLKRIIKPWDGDIDSFLKPEARKTYLLDEHENIIGLNLWNCGLSDISFLELLPNLTQLNLSINRITDCSFLKGLPNLTQLYLSGNKITDYSFLKGVPNLIQLYLNGNEITDGSFLKALPDLTHLGLRANKISNYNFLKSLPNLTYLDLYKNKITDCSFLKSLPNLTQLYLNDNEITDCSFLKSLPNLTQVDLSGNQITDASFLIGLSDLTGICLGNNKMKNFSFLTALPNLKLLDLWGTKFTFFTFIEALHNLRELRLGDNQITDCSFLRDLLNLTRLSISNTKILDCSFLRNLPNLTQLSLSFNKISDCSFLAGLPNLTQLDLSFNKISDCSFLAGLPNLTQIDLSDNKISDCSFLAGLPNLTQLDLSSNKISDCSFLAGLPNLTQIDLSDNKISDFSFCEHLKHIRTLDLRKNNIRQLPDSLLGLNTEIEWGEEYASLPNSIILYGNPIETPPLEIVKQGHFAIETYFKSLEAGENKALGEVKVLLVGDGGSGKTSLVKRLFDEGFDSHQAKTDGIQIRPLEIRSDTQTIKARFWDFGGQEVMHATHQFFLSKRSLYILVLDGRKEEDAEYWLKHIESFGGNSPILIVLNKTDQNPGFDVNRRFLQDKYKEIRGFYRISCATGAGIEEFQKNLNDELQAVEFIRTVWAKSWFNVKSCLENLNKHFISFQEYREICGKESIGDMSAQDTLVGFLNDLGVVVHFRDLNLSAMYVLEPKWVTEAVYKIINSKDLAENKGVLNLGLLNKILCQKAEADYCYPFETYHYIINLMKKFELCYTINDDTVLIPGLLAIQEPKIKFDPAKALKFRLEYDFLPKSVMPRFIVKRHKDIKNKLQWRTGVVLEDKSFHAIAVVKADVRDRKIEIWVMGEQKRDYFSVIRKTLSDINNSFEKLSVKELIPLPDHPEIAIEYEELLGYERARRDEYFIGKLGKLCSVSKLLNGIEKKEERQQRMNQSVHVHFDNSVREMRVGGNVESSTLIAGDENELRQ